LANSLRLLLIRGHVCQSPVVLPAGELCLTANLLYEGKEFLLRWEVLKDAMNRSILKRS
jgi:hypothetical protein